MRSSKEWTLKVGLIEKKRMLFARMYILNPVRLNNFHRLSVQQLREPKRDSKVRQYMELHEHKTSHTHGPALVYLPDEDFAKWREVLDGKEDAACLFANDQTCSDYVHKVNFTGQRTKVNIDE